MRFPHRTADFKDETGAAVVEFALVLPILLLLVVGIMDFGRAFNYSNDETHLANQAARFAAVNANPGGSQSLQAYVRSQADSAELRNGGSSSVPSPVQLCISFPNGTSKVGDPVKVTVSATYNWLPFLQAKSGLTTSTLSASATMRLEAEPTNYSAGCA